MIGKITLQKALYPKQSLAIVLFVFQGDFKNISFLPREILSKIKIKRDLHDFKGKESEVLAFENVGSYDKLLLVGLGKKDKSSSKKFKNILADALRQVKRSKTKEVDIVSPGLNNKPFEIGENVAMALHLSNYQFDKYKSQESKKKITYIEKLNFYLGRTNEKEFQKGVNWGEQIASGIYLTRDLVNEPAAHVTPYALADVARAIAKESKGKIKAEVLEEAECRKLGMGAYLGVAQGSEHKPKFIVLRYVGDAARNVKRKTICIIGKSITFDSGGLSLKPSEHMEDMKIDMAGGATVLGLFKVLAQMNDKLGYEVYGLLPACENMPSDHAMRPGDVVTALNGKTIEVLNTDAEGRLALADAISYAEKYIKPGVIIDLATLTGACMVALGDDVAGLFGNDDKLIENFKKVADHAGDELWPLPLYKPYAKRMKSHIADLKNITGGRYGGAITAALFLNEFVKGAKWIHIDIAGPAHRSEGPKGVLDRGATGWGVASLIEFLRSS